MTGRQRRADDPLWLHAVRARLARIKVAKAARETAELADQWPPNVIETVLLRRRLGDDRDATRRRHEPST